MPVLQEQKPVIEARFSAAVWSCALFGTLTFLPLPRFASVTCARYLLLGANTPWAERERRIAVQREALESLGSPSSKSVDTL